MMTISTASDILQDWWARMTHGAKYGATFTYGPNHIELNKVYAIIQTCNAMGTRLVSDEVIQKHNDCTLENWTEHRK